MNQPQSIIQPGEIRLNCDHKQDPSGNDPLQPINAHMGDRVAVIGGLTCREEIASRILAGMVGGIVGPHPHAEVTLNPPGIVETALTLADALLAKTRPQPEPPPA